MSALHREHPDADTETVDQIIAGVVALGRGVVECEQQHAFKVVPNSTTLIDEATRDTIGRPCPTCGCPLELAS